MRSGGTALSTSVQAEKQGPSMTTRSPDCRRVAKSFRYSVTSPPELAMIRTSPAAGAKAMRDKTVANTMRRTEPSLGQTRARDRHLVRSSAGISTGAPPLEFHGAVYLSTAPNGARHKGADRRVTWPPTTSQAMSWKAGSAAGAALPGGRLISDAGVRRAIRQAVDGLAAAEAEVPPARIADRPAAFSFAQLGQRASRLLRDRHLLHRGRRGAAQGRENVVLGDQP